MKDLFGRQWYVYKSALHELLSLQKQGQIEAWWTIVKKGSSYGLMIDTNKPLQAVVPLNEDVPSMLDNATDLHTLIPYFLKMAV